MPRMGDFWRSFPEISVDHLISDDSREFRRAEVDLRVRYGFGGWPDETATPLMSETIYPIASPDFARRHAGCTAATIPELPLLHVDWADAEWTGWDELLRRAGIPHGALPGRRFSTFGVVLRRRTSRRSASSRRPARGSATCPGSSSRWSCPANLPLARHCLAQVVGWSARARRPRGVGQYRRLVIRARMPGRARLCATGNSSDSSDR